ncbi:ankyrin [Bimuria novae-zelandiae CBS 107.79]|uniref:Ankyrin n=1 Tax=Bimuria novae-zelandiae CBS 107.79 TaxID=1447943 RepID=A0A6A5UWE6_9PLEO|nr:ankyrin [Bimuria novae-zelandiae CBS 107.79]
MGFAELPKELLQVILHYAIILRGIKRGMRLRLVSKRFAVETIDTIYTYRMLDEQLSQKFEPPDRRPLPPWMQSYLEYRVHNAEENANRHPVLSLFRATIRTLVAENDALQYDDCARLLCGLISEGGPARVYELFRSATYRPLLPDAELLQIKGSSKINLGNTQFVAAVVTNTTSIVELHVGSYHRESSEPLFAPDARGFNRLAACYADRETLGLLLSSEGPTGINISRRNGMFVAAAGLGRLSTVRFIHDFRLTKGSWDFIDRRGRYESERIFKEALNTPSREVWDYVVRLRSDYGLSKNFRQDHKTRLLAACVLEGGEAHLIEHLLDMGADVDGNDMLGDPLTSNKVRPILDACRYDDEDVVRLLLAKDADTTFAVCVAAAHGHANIVRLLLEHGADPFGGLLRAASKGYMDIVKILLHAGVDAGEEDVRLDLYGGLEKYDLCTVPIVSAIALEHVEMASLLKEKGARVDGYAGRQCFRIVRKYGLESMLTLLGSWGAEERDLPAVG